MEITDVLRPRKESEEFDGARGPAGSIVRKELEHRQGSLPPAISHRVGHVHARKDCACTGLSTGSDVVRSETRINRRLVPDALTAVADDPVFAGLDKPILIKSGDIVFDHIGLSGDDAKKRAQRFTLVEVAHAMYNR